MFFERGFGGAEAGTEFGAEDLALEAEFGGGFRGGGDAAAEAEGGEEEGLVSRDADFGVWLIFLRRSRFHICNFLRFFPLLYSLLDFFSLKRSFFFPLKSLHFPLQLLHPQLPLLPSKPSPHGRTLHNSPPQPPPPQPQTLHSSLLLPKQILIQSTHFINRPQYPLAHPQLHEGIQGGAPEAFVEDVDAPGAAGFDAGAGADVVAELDALAAVEAAVGLFVPLGGAVGVGGDGGGEGVGGGFLGGVGGFCGSGGGEGAEAVSAEGY